MKRSIICTFVLLIIATLLLAIINRNNFDYSAEKVLDKYINSREIKKIKTTMIRQSDGMLIILDWGEKKDYGYYLKILSAKEIKDSIEITYIAKKIENGNEDLKTSRHPIDSIKINVSTRAESYKVVMKNISKAKMKGNLIKLSDIDNSFIFDIRYATKNNFAKVKMYPAGNCAINIDTAIKLIAANEEFKSHGYKIKIFDAYRPISVQKYMWKVTPNKKYVANPKYGSVHNRGCAIDVTLVDMSGREVEMTSNYDEFSSRAHINYNGGSSKAKENRKILAQIMTKHGFRRISNEWWHFEDVNYKSYPLQDVSIQTFNN